MAQAPWKVSLLVCEPQTEPGDLYIIQQKELCRWDSPVSTGVLEDLEAESGSTNLEADVSDSGT